MEFIGLGFDKVCLGKWLVYLCSDSSTKATLIQEKSRVYPWAADDPMQSASETMRQRDKGQ